MIADPSEVKQNPFLNKIALITGSGRGIGRAIAIHFARSLGADVVVNFFRNRLPAEETAAEIRALGRRALVVKANIGEIDEQVAEWRGCEWVTKGPASPRRCAVWRGRSAHCPERGREAAMEKIYVLDTNVLVHDPEALLRFEEHEIVLPIAVIEELDGLKRGQGEIPTSVRQALRLIDSFREKGNLSRGVPLPHGGSLRVETADDGQGRVRTSADNSIILTAVKLGAHSRQPVVLVSKDLAVRIKAEALGVPAQDYRNDKTTIFRSGMGDGCPRDWAELNVPAVV